MKASLIALALAALAIGCTSELDTKIVDISGKAQKGPLLAGSIVTLSETNNKLIQSGKVFTTNTISDDGFFELSQVKMSSNYALLTASGYYFNEVYGQVSPAQLTLQAYVNVENKNRINVNILTHLTKQRIEKLVANGKTIDDAKTQAEQEFLSFLGQSSALDCEFEDMDISQSDETNAILLAFSVISQRYSPIWGQDANATGELTELLTLFGNDFKEDGQINEQPLIDTLIHNIIQLNLEQVRAYVENRYTQEGKPSTIPNFEKYVTLFQKNHSKVVHPNFVYPEKASPDLVMSPETKIQNILASTDGSILAKAPYSVAAIVPFDQKLRIRITNKSGNPVMRGGVSFGWKQSYDPQTQSITLEPTVCNTLISTLIHLEGSGTATIEFFENDFTQAKESREIQW
jgi:hypothetical protein